LRRSPGAISSSLPIIFATAKHPRPKSANRQSSIKAASQPIHCPLDRSGHRPADRYRAAPDASLPTHEERSEIVQRAEKVITMSDELSDKLDILIKLQAAALTAQMESTKDKIVFLSKAGLRPTLIADIVGTTVNHVNVTLSNARKLSKTK
jgi:hypothetical protein